MWEAVQPDLRTAGDGGATYKGKPFVTPHGPCRAASLADCIIK